MKLELGRKQTWSAELFNRVFMLKIHYPTDSGGLLQIVVDCSCASVLLWHGGKWWKVFIVLHQKGLTPSWQCMLPLCFFVLLVTSINFAFLSRAPDCCTSVWLCLSPQPWPRPALRAADLSGCAPLCFIFRRGWCWNAIRASTVWILNGKRGLTLTSWKQKSSFWVSKIKKPSLSCAFFSHW